MVLYHTSSDVSYLNGDPYDAWPILADDYVFESFKAGFFLGRSILLVLTGISFVSASAYIALFVCCFHKGVID